jgi:hypothetical protein
MRRGEPSEAENLFSSARHLQSRNNCGAIVFRILKFSKSKFLKFPNLRNAEFD